MSMGSEVLKDRIKSSGMTQKEVAEGSGVAPQLISRFMLGNGGLSLKSAEKIFAFLAVAKVHPRRIEVRRPKDGKEGA